MEGKVETGFVYLPWKFRRKNIKDSKNILIDIDSKASICPGYSKCNFAMVVNIMVVVFILQVDICSAQMKGLFPAINDLSSFTNVRTTSSCGLNKKPMTYCISSVSDESMKSCTQRTCLFNCCPTCGIASPSSLNLDNAPKSNGVYISSQRHPYSKSIASNSYNFLTGYISSPSTVSSSSNFTFTVWIKQEKLNDG